MSSVQKIELHGESIPLADLSISLSQTLTDLVDKINQLTNRSVAMSGALGEVQAGDPVHAGFDHPDRKNQQADQTALS